MACFPSPAMLAALTWPSQPKHVDHSPSRLLAHRPRSTKPEGEPVMRYHEPNPSGPKTMSSYPSPSTSAARMNLFEDQLPYLPWDNGFAPLNPRPGSFQASGVAG